MLRRTWNTQEWYVREADDTQKRLLVCFHAKDEQAVRMDVKTHVLDEFLEYTVVFPQWGGADDDGMLQAIFDKYNHYERNAMGGQDSVNLMTRAGFEQIIVLSADADPLRELAKVEGPHRTTTTDPSAPDFESTAKTFYDAKRKVVVDKPILNHPDEMKRGTIRDREYYFTAKRPRDKMLVILHGSRTSALAYAYSTTFREVFDGYFLVFPQSRGEVTPPTLHKHYNNITHGDLYWGLTDLEGIQEDISFIEDILEKYSPSKKYIIGRSNGGVFALKVMHHFDGVVSYQGGMGYNPHFTIDPDQGSWVLFLTGTEDVHRMPCELAHELLPESSDLIIVKGHHHMHYKSDELIMRRYLEALPEHRPSVE
eukprot:TRINITY_DN3199_c4_g1_i2.p1 TRINITY_DN3199_c4_g1~~TRINITY_DN3199_c4_g1_i2.p1  ORF type:complete len:368 (+),score=61.71 TRINITY_DN3199_c4_g1_i2:56-1159(+)